MKLDPSGNFLFIGSAGSPGFISVFSLNAGVPSPVAGAAAGGNPFGLAVDSAGSFLYVANNLDSSISTFSISAGALTEISGSPVGETLTSAPVALVVDPSGKYLYVANEGSSNISAYTISSGALTVLTNSPFGGVTSPNSIIADPSGKYLLVGSGSSSGTITVYRLDASTGTLTSLSSYSTGSTPTSIAVSQ
jgi:6-phosphogluconolactonase (cycloisomerase 2 family)